MKRIRNDLQASFDDGKVVKNDFFLIVMCLVFVAYVVEWCTLCRVALHITFGGSVPARAVLLVAKTDQN